MVSMTFIAEHIHLRYAFKVARKAAVSLASTARTNPDSSLQRTTLARLATGELGSGARASKSVVRCLSDESCKRIFAFAFVILLSAQLNKLTFDKNLYSTNKAKKRTMKKGD